MQARWKVQLLAATLGVWIRCGWAMPALLADGVVLEWREGLPWLSASSSLGDVTVLERSSDLLEWREWARVRGGLHWYSDGSAARDPRGFYRVGRRAATSTDDWSNQLSPGVGDLFSPAQGAGQAAPRFCKFTILLNRPDQVFFQDSAKWPYHYHFARARLPGYEGMSVLEYNAQALYANARQRMVVGSVMRAPDAQVRELGVEITGAEAFPAVGVADWFEAVRRRMIVEPGWRVLYLPSVEQRAMAEAHRPMFEARGIEVDSLKRWVTANTCYAAGWALGKLVYVPGTEISMALADGRLGLADILVTDQVPAELPVLAGYVCLEPATPNSHVAILARSLALPMTYVVGAGLRAEFKSLYGREVLLIVEEAEGVCKVTVQDTTGRLTPERRAEILASKRGGALGITPMAVAGSISLPVDGLTPADVRFVGGKAANFGFLRRRLPQDTPSPVLAFTFDLWRAFLSQRMGSGQTLGEEIGARVAGYTYPPDVSRLRADLAAIRERMTEDADFSIQQRLEVLSTLQRAGLLGRKIRFRSSTNVEDVESFSGAGLYDSFSGCLEDDLDGDERGPSRCDPEENRERGVFRAIRKVYASFYNENAFLERLRHGVKESNVGMALLVHYSTPDPLEMANGVVTLTVDRRSGERRATARVVAQLGAVSVTNPEVGTRAEVVTAQYAGQNTSGAVLQREESSSLTPGGEAVMPWEGAYRALLEQIHAVSEAWEDYYPDKVHYELDFEFKRTVPGVVGLKQVRAVPQPETVPPPTIP